MPSSEDRFYPVNMNEIDTVMMSQYNSLLEQINKMYKEFKACNLTTKIVNLFRSQTKVEKEIEKILCGLCEGIFFSGIDKNESMDDFNWRVKNLASVMATLSTTFSSDKRIVNLLNTWVGELDELTNSSLLKSAQNR